MAKSKTNKSAAIRDYLKSNRKAEPQQIIEALAAKGITVKVGLVYEVKKRIKDKRRRRVAGVAIARAGTNGVVDPVKLIQETRALAVKAGGVRKLMELLEALT